MPVGPTNPVAPVGPDGFCFTVYVMKSCGVRARSSWLANVTLMGVPRNATPLFSAGLVIHCCASAVMSHATARRGAFARTVVVDCASLAMGGAVSPLTVSSSQGPRTAKTETVACGGLPLGTIRRTAWSMTTSGGTVATSNLTRIVRSWPVKSFRD